MDEIVAGLLGWLLWLLFRISVEVGLVIVFDVVCLLCVVYLGFGFLWFAV